MANEQRTASGQSQSKRSKRSNGRKHEPTSYEQELAGYLQERIKPGLNSGAIPLLARSIAKEIAERGAAAGASGEEESKDEPGAEGEDTPRGETSEEPSAEAKGEDESGAEHDGKAEGADEAEAKGDEGAQAKGDEDAEAEGDEDADAEAKSDEDAEAEGDEDTKAEGGDESEADEQPDFEADMRDFQAELGEDWILRFSVHGDDAWLTADKTDGSQHLEAETADVLADAIGVLEKAAD